MTNEKIVKILKQKYNLPVFYRKVFEKDLKNYNYFIYGETNLRKDTCRYYQTIEVVWVTERGYNPGLQEIDIIETLESIGLRLAENATYDEVQISKTNQYLDIVTFHFSRPVKK